MTAKPHPEELEPLLVEPCQFCTSSKVEFLRTSKSPARSGAVDVWVYCRGCSASGPHAPTAELAAQYWNLGKPEEPAEKKP